VSDTVLVDRSGAVATITLNRPDGMNALTLEAKEALLAAVSAAAADDDVRAVVITGTGRAFCVGQDLREHAALIAADDPAPLSTVKEHYNPLISQIVSMPKPVIAAINGTAAGAGLGIACVCDFRIGAAGSRYTTAFTGIGLTADSGLSWSLPRLVGSGRATALLMLAEPFTSEQALEMGILNACVAPEQVLPAATELAQKLAAGPTAAYACVKESVLYGADASLADALIKEDELQTRAGATEDHKNAVSSFLAKTPPVFTGR
jgi:2-(1,2-epoxy-1,2-dihydrophenyl)acetyl-CoA isomerase